MTARDPRFAELDRLIAEEDAREALKAPAPKVVAHRSTESRRWATMRSRRETCQHEQWRRHGVQIMCINCGKTACRWIPTEDGVRPL